MNKAKSRSHPKRPGCKEASREFSFLCVLCASALGVTGNGKSS